MKQLFAKKQPAQSDAESVNLKKETVFDTTTVAETSRFVMADFQNWGVFIIGRLKRALPFWNDANYLGKLRGCMDSNSFCFLKAKQSVGLATIGYDDLDPRPVVNLIFLFTKREEGTPAEQARDMIKVLRGVQRWGKRLQAKRIDFGPDCDLSDDELTKMVRAQKREEFCLALLKGTDGDKDIPLPAEEAKK